MPTAIRAYIRSLGIDAYVVGGAVRDELLGIPHRDEDFLVPGVDQAGLRALLEPHGRVEDMEVHGQLVRDEMLGIPHRDEDFLVPGVDQAGLRALLEPHGRVEDMQVHGQLVGVRLHPSDRAVRALVPAGIDLTPPRAERSTGRGTATSRSSATPRSGSRRTWPAATSRSTPWPAGSRTAASSTRSAASTTSSAGSCAPSARRASRTTRSARPRAAVRLAARLRPRTRDAGRCRGEEGGGKGGKGRKRKKKKKKKKKKGLSQMHDAAPGLAHVSAERIGGGIKADAQGELSKLLLGRKPARALFLARDTGVLTRVIPEFAPAIGFSLGSDRQPLPLDEHLFAVAQLAADSGSSLEVRLAGLLHDLGKPLDEGDDDDHPRIGAALADEILERLRYPTRVRHHVVWIVAHHGFKLDHPPDARDARRFLAEHGDALAHDLIDHKAGRPRREERPRRRARARRGAATAA